MACRLPHAIGRVYEMVAGRRAGRTRIGCGYRVTVRGLGDRFILTARGLPLAHRLLRAALAPIARLLGAKPLQVYKSIDIDADRLAEMLVLAGSVRAPYITFYGVMYNPIRGRRLSRRELWPVKLVGVAAAAAVETCSTPKWVCVAYEKGLDLREMIDLVELHALLDVLPGVETCIACAPSVAGEPRLLVEVSRLRGSSYVDLRLLGHSAEDVKALLEELLSGLGGAGRGEEEGGVL